jgi:hypothetical protein
MTLESRLAARGSRFAVRGSRFACDAVKKNAGRGGVPRPAFLLCDPRDPRPV